MRAVEGIGAAHRGLPALSGARPDRELERRESGSAWAGPVLLGAMTGSMVAARFESGALCIAVAVGVSLAIQASRPSRLWLVTVGVGVGLALLLNLYLTPGPRLLGPALFGLHPTAAGLGRGILLALRLVGATAAIHGLRAAWPGERAADELARLFMPLERLRVPVREARAMVALALRFAPLLATEARRIARIQDLRAGRAARGPGEWLTRRRAAFVPTLVAALERADRVALALEARHFRARAIPAPAARSGRWAAIGIALAAVALLWR